MVVDWMLSQSRVLIVVKVMKSMIAHESTATECLVRVQLGNTMVIRHYSDMLIYANLYDDMDLNIKYGEKVMSVSVNEFQTHAAHTSDDVKDNDKRCRQTPIVPAAFHPLHFVNDPQSL